MILLVGTLTFLSVAQTRLYLNPGSHTIISVGWAGYIVASSFNQQQDVVAISASWVVPQVNSSAQNGYSSAWIGIGGQTDKNLIQVGTEHNLLNGYEYYDVWYEMLPDYAIRLSNFTVAPGHFIAASISLIDNATSLWNVMIADKSNGEYFSQNFVYNSSRSSGEWIAERSMVSNQISHLADFGSVTFQGCKVQVGEKEGVIGNFTYSIVDMTNEQLDTLASTSQLYNDSASFTVTYQRSS